MQIAKSAWTLGFVWCTIKLTPNGAAFFPVSLSNSFNAVLISIIHCSKPSVVLWLSAGKVPIMPFLQHSITNLGPEIKNIGAAITGSESDSKNLGFDIFARVFYYGFKDNNFYLPLNSQQKNKFFKK
jgi:hypothetical protein